MATTTPQQVILEELRLSDLESERLDPKALEESNIFSGPIPGQTLTNDPDDPKPFEKPPKFTNIKEAQMAIFTDLSSPETLASIAEAIANNVSLETLAKMILIRGYQMGMFNPDLMVLLIEPVLYMLLILAEKMEIPYRMFEEDNPETDLDTEEENEILKGVRGQQKQESRFGKIRPTEISPDSVSPEIIEKLKQLPVENSLLAKPPIEEQQQQQQQEQSLLAAR